MPNNKVKSLSKVKGADKAHPYSRRATQMRRAIHRDSKLEASRDAKEVDRRRKIDRLLFFKYVMPDGVKQATVSDLHDFVELYINRNQEEMEQLKSQHRKGRPKPMKLEKLEMVKAQDQAEYVSGFEIPELTKSDIVTFIKGWDGDFNGIPRIKTVRLCAKDKPTEQMVE